MTQGKFLNCPKCGSDDLSIREYMDNNELYAEIKCNYCGYKWTEKIPKK